MSYVFSKLTVIIWEFFFPQKEEKNPNSQNTFRQMTTLKTVSHESKRQTVTEKKKQISIGAWIQFSNFVFRNRFDISKFFKISLVLERTTLHLWQ